MDINLPAVPAGVLTLLALFAPYVIAIINRPAWSGTTKRVVAVAASVVLAAVILLFYFAFTGEPVPHWGTLILLFVVVAQASYALLAKPSAEKVEDATADWFEPGTGLRRDRR